MIYSLKGRVEMIDENTLVVDTGSVSFEVFCSSFAVSYLSSSKDEQTILTYLQVREDAMCLFGFKDKKEKMLFNDLMLVSGVGPKMAITILSGLQADDLIRAIISSHVKTLSGIKGLGKKTAERIVLELNSKLGGTDALENLMLGTDTAKQRFEQSLPRAIDEAVDVLVSTGIQKVKALELAKNNYSEGITGEELLVLCFKNLK